MCLELCVKTTCSLPYNCHKIFLHASTWYKAKATPGTLCIILQHVFGFFCPAGTTCELNLIVVHVSIYQQQDNEIKIFMPVKYVEPIQLTKLVLCVRDSRHRCTI